MSLAGTTRPVWPYRDKTWKSGCSFPTRYPLVRAAMEEWAQFPILHSQGYTIPEEERNGREGTAYLAW